MRAEKGASLGPVSSIPGSGTLRCVPWPALCALSAPGGSLDSGRHLGFFCCLSGLRVPGGPEGQIQTLPFPSLDTNMDKTGHLEQEDGGKGQGGSCWTGFEDWAGCVEIGVTLSFSRGMHMASRQFRRSLKIKRKSKSTVIPLQTTATRHFLPVFFFCSFSLGFALHARNVTSSVILFLDSSRAEMFPSVYINGTETQYPQLPNSRGCVGTVVAAGQG